MKSWKQPLYIAVYNCGTVKPSKYRQSFVKACLSEYGRFSARPTSGDIGRSDKVHCHNSQTTKKSKVKSEYRLQTDVKIE